MRKILLISFLMLITISAYSQTKQKMLGDSEKLLPMLKNEIVLFWPELIEKKYQAFPAGIISQESNWKINAKLKTEREYGCGLGQHTKAYNKDGSIRFDSLEETKKLHKSLANWNWNDCFNWEYQLRGTVLKLKSNQRDCNMVMIDFKEALKCNAAKYNGGAGSVAKRIRSCRVTKGCNPKLWEGHLATQCPQSKVKVAGYGESFCEINSKYPGRVFMRMKPFEGKL